MWPKAWVVLLDFPEGTLQQSISRQGEGYLDGDTNTPGS